MTQRREIEAHLELYEDLAGILGAMRSFALAELRRVTRREQAQQQVLQTMSAALDDLAFALPQPPAGSAPDIWLLFGSVRGFCGSFNEDVLRTWRAQQGTQDAIVVVGERLADMMPDVSGLHPVAGAEGGLDASQAIDRILTALGEVRLSAGMEAGLVACLRDEDGARVQRLLPLLATGEIHVDNPLLTNEPVTRVAAEVTEHYLFHALLALLLRSIRVENHLRLRQMENAMRHLERGSGELQRQRNRMRQEEIVEEIELMARERKHP